MPIFRLNDDEELFPPPHLADPSGLLAVGGSLTPRRLLAAYRRGIFPWYSEGQPILWHSPDPRFVLVPEELHVPKSLSKVLRKGVYEVRFDTAFAEVIEGCARTPRPRQRGTWLTEDMKRAYTQLHELGYAHSAEAWRDGNLVGGLYGVHLHPVFFGESMFAREPDASKVAFVTLVQKLSRDGCTLIDCQQETHHLARFGAQSWPRPHFLKVLHALPAHLVAGKWTAGELI